MVFLLSEKRFKADMMWDNVDAAAYIRPALMTAQDIHLREVLGDKLLNEVMARVKANRLEGYYKELVDEYCIPFLEFQTAADMVVPSTFKQRNAGVVQTYDSNLNTMSVSDVKYMEQFYLNKVGFYQNRLVKYLNQNKTHFPEYNVCGCGDNVTNPVDTVKQCGIFLNGR